MNETIDQLTHNNKCNDFDIKNNDNNEQGESNDNNKSFYVYCLLSTANTTYIGATIDLDRRLRQHNKEIKGGAKLTSIQVNKGHSWSRICYVS